CPARAVDIVDRLAADGAADLPHVVEGIFAVDFVIDRVAGLAEILGRIIDGGAQRQRFDRIDRAGELALVIVELGAIIVGARIEVADDAEVPAHRTGRGRPAGVEVEFHAGAGRAQARAPGAGIELVIAPVEAALHGGIFTGERNTAENIVAD